MTDKQIAEKIKEYRRNNNLTQEQLARRLDMPTISISRWERGQNMSGAYRKLLKQAGVI